MKKTVKYEYRGSYYNDYVLIYLDKDGNELDRKIKRRYTKDEVFKLARAILAESMINDLYSIDIRKI